MNTCTACGNEVYLLHSVRDEILVLDRSDVKLLRTIPVEVAG